MTKKFTVYQPSFLEYQRYLASIQDHRRLSDSGTRILVSWYENSKKVLI